MTECADRQRQKSRIGFSSMLFCMLCAFVAIVFTVGGPSIALAEEADVLQDAQSSAPAYAVLPVRQDFAASDTSANSTFSYQLIADDVNNPLPQGGQNGIYRWTMTGTDQQELIFEVSAVGTYDYTMKAVLDAPVEGYTYDTTVYRVHVFVNESATGGLASVVLAENAAGKKLDDPGWYHSYTGKIIPPVDRLAKTGDTPLAAMIMATIAALALMLITLAWATRRRSAKKDDMARQGVTKSTKKDWFR